MTMTKTKTKTKIMSRTQAKTKTMIITMNTKGTICLFWFCYFFLYNDVKLSFCISNQCMVHSLGEGCKLCRCQRGRLGLGCWGKRRDKVFGGRH